MIRSAIMEAVDLVVERRSKAGREARGIWYHGTQPKNLKSILSQGLKAVWKNKNWGNDPDAGRLTVDRTSYGGVYVTKNLMTALSSTTRGSFKGSRDGNLIVIMELQPRSLAADEDSFTRWMADVPMDGIRWGGLAAAILWFSMMNMNLPDEIDVENMSRDEYDDYVRKRDNRRIYDETWEAYQERFYENYRIFNSGAKASPQQKKAAEPFLREAFHAAIERMAGYFPEEYGKWWKSDWHRQYSLVDPNVKEDEVPNPPNPKEGEAKFRKAIDKITKIFTAPVTVKKGSFITARSLEDIKFSGSNRIVSIVEVDTNKRGPHKLIVHYGTPPADFFQQWDERWGSKLYVVDRNGKRLPQYDKYSTVIQELEDKIEEAAKTQSKHIGWKIVASDGKGGAVSLYDKKVPVNITVGSITKDTYLGNSPEYVNMFFRAASDPEDAQDIILKFEYDKSDLIKGDPDFQNGEVQVKKAKLISVHPLPRLFDDEDGNDIRRHLEESSDSSIPKYVSPHLDLLKPKGESKSIGREAGKFNQNGSSRFVSPYGSYRYVQAIKGEIIGFLQIVSRDGKTGIIANVFVKEDHRRKGIAKKLLAKAKKDFDKIHHSDDLSDMGKAWRNSLDENYETAIPYPKKRIVTKIDGVDLKLYHEGDTLYVEWIFVPKDGMGQKTLEKLRKTYKVKKVIALDPIKSSRGFWDKMLERGVIDDIMHGVPSYEKAGEQVLISDDEYQNVSDYYDEDDEDHGEDGSLPSWIRTENIEAHEQGNTMWLDLIEIPKGQQRRGFGRKEYEEWEASLPKKIKLVKLMAADMGDGNSQSFWEKMGFDFVYTADNPEIIPYEQRQEMQKGVNGYPTPKSIEWEKYTESASPKRWEPGDKPYLNNPDPADIKSPKVNFRGLLPNDATKAVIVIDGIQMTVPVARLSDTPQCESVKPGVKQALVLVHIDSLDSYASQGGSIDIGKDWRDAMSKFNGETIVISQGWHNNDNAFSRDAMNMVRNIVQSADHVIEFDETDQGWEPFLKSLDALLKKLGITNVDVGGIWYDPQGETGCATKVIQFLQKKGYKVTPRKELLGCEEDIDKNSDVFESKSGEDVIKLYHGTDRIHADSLIKNGWSPSNIRKIGRNGGKPNLLYVTDTFDNAMWYAERTDSPVVLRLKVSKKDLIVDPEDGIGDTVDDELSNSPFPANLAVRNHLPPSAFEEVPTNESINKSLNNENEKESILDREAVKRGYTICYRGSNSNVLSTSDTGWVFLTENKDVANQYALYNNGHVRKYYVDIRDAVDLTGSSNANGPLLDFLKNVDNPSPELSKVIRDIESIEDDNSEDNAVYFWITDKNIIKAITSKSNVLLFTDIDLNGNDFEAIAVSDPSIIIKPKDLGKNVSRII